ncbi:MAG TPA: zinc ABC transporter ATP-binding protein AztA [Bosea sp. (in: a-proteobacteria)]
MSAIRLQDLTLGYDRHPAVHHLSGEIASGSLTAIVGPNGAGKSTLLKGIAGALSPLGGDVSVAGGKRLAYLPQSAELDRSFPIHVYDLVAMGLWSSAGIFGRIGRGAAAKVEAAIAAVGLSGFERRPIGALSGGQMQRALFARLLLQDADIILLDEPFTAIDARTTADLLALVQRWHGESRTVVAVLHDIETVRRAFPHTLLLARETVAWGETAQVLTPANLLKARRMVEAFDSHAAPCERDAA